MDNVAAAYGDRIQLAEGMYAAAEGADALAIMTEWHPFRRPDFRRLHSQMQNPAIFDGRNIWDPAELTRLGFAYQGIGRRPPR